MVASKHTLDKLENLGLNLYERKLYVALLSRGVSTAGELSEMTGVPRSRAYDVLESLAEKGFSIIKPAKPMEYVAVPPEEALENAKEDHREEFEHKIERIEKFKDTDAAEELVELYNKGVSRVDPQDMTGALKGRYNVYQHLGNMIKSAEDEVKFYTTENGLNDLHENHYNALQKAASNDVDVRILAPVTDDNQTAAEALGQHSEVREPTHDEEHTPNSRFLIVDNEKIALALTDDDVHPTQDAAVWSESDHAARDAFTPVFENIWSEGQPAH